MQSRKNHVILTAKGLFKTQGFTASSIQDIINKCEISKGTFYNYFTSKNEFIIAYLKATHKEEYDRRNTLLEGKNIADKDVFVKQILVRMEVTSEYTLRPIFEYAFYSKDKELKKFIEARLIEELSWIAKRIIDLYGKESIHYASDCAVFIHGMIQNMLMVWKALTKEDINMTLLIQYIIRRLDDIMASLIGTEDYFLHDLQLSQLGKNKKSFIKATMIKDLVTIKQNVDADNKALKEHLAFLSEEIANNEPRIHLLHSCIHTSIELTSEKKQQEHLQKLQQQLDDII